MMHIYTALYISWLMSLPRIFDTAQQDSTFDKLDDEECHVLDVLMSNKLVPRCLPARSYTYTHMVVCV